MIWAKMWVAWRCEGVGELNDMKNVSSIPKCRYTLPEKLLEGDEGETTLLLISGEQIWIGRTC